MFNFMRSRTLHHYWCFSSKHEFYVLLNHSFSSSSSSKKTAEAIAKSLNKESFTVSYLMKSCGLSQERALLAAKRVSFGTSENPDSVLAFLKNCGFSDAQVSVVIRKYPRLLVCNPEKALSPKFKFFQSLGFSKSDITALVTKSQNLLLANLEALIIPNVNLLGSFFSSQPETVFCIKRYPDILARNFENKVTDNIRIFVEAGVPESTVVSWFKRQPRSFLTSSDKVKDSVEELMKMEFNPHQKYFLCGAYVMIAMNRLMWKEKMELFKTWGFSEDTVMAAFRLNPWFMAASKEQIQKVMDFFVHKIGFDPVEVIRSPMVLSLSLERTIIPRYSVYQVLLSRGLVKKQPPISIFKYAKRYFLQKFVLCHSDSAPELLKLVQPSG